MASFTSARIQRRSRDCSVERRKGLLSMSSMPAARQARLESSKALAVRARIGVWRSSPSSFLILFVASRPSITGIWQSHEHGVEGVVDRLFEDHDRFGAVVDHLDTASEAFEHADATNLLGADVIELDGEALWVTIGSESFTNPGVPPRGQGVWRIDTATGQVTNRYPLTFTPGHGVAVTDEAVWLVNPERNAVVRLDLSSGRMIEITVGRTPNAVDVSSDAVWVTNGRDGTVSRIDKVTFDVDTITVGGHPEDIDVDGDSVWVAVRT